jgi:ABC-2 type transport system ATP-binding protein
MNDAVILTEKLTKKYNDFTAVNSLNLKVNRGEIFGLLGPNGAGKTTTILMLLGLTEPTSGKVNVLGHDPTRQPLLVKSQAGYIPEQVGFYEDLTARQNLAYIAKLNGIKGDQIQERIDDALNTVNLSAVANKFIRTFSRGMRQRLSVADVLIKKPELIVMDEPTQGLDPESARDFLKLIRQLGDAGITILLSSHLLDQVQRVCDRVGLFHQGKMVLEGTVSELASKIFGGAYHIHLNANGANQNYQRLLANLPGVIDVNFISPDAYSLIATQDLRSEAAKAIVNAGGSLYSIGLDSFNLDDIYNAYFKEVNNDQKNES